MVDYTPSERGSFYFLRTISSISKLLVFCFFFYGRHFKQIATVKHKHIHDTFQRVHPPVQSPIFSSTYNIRIFLTPWARTSKHKTDGKHFYYINQEVWLRRGWQSFLQGKPLHFCNTKGQIAKKQPLSLKAIWLRQLQLLLILGVWRTCPRGCTQPLAAWSLGKSHGVHYSPYSPSAASSSHMHQSSLLHPTL